MTRLNDREVEEMRTICAEAREDFGGWVIEHDLSRAFIAQCDLIDRLLDRGDHERAGGAIEGLLAALRGAGPQSFRGRVEVEGEEW